MERLLLIGTALTAFAIFALCKRALERRRYLANVLPEYHPVLDTTTLASLPFDIPPIVDFQRDITAREIAMNRLSRSVNKQLQRLLETHRENGREQLACVLIESVEYLVFERLNPAGYSLDRLDYGGDINYENSEQTYFNGTETVPGLFMEFHGFECKMSWLSLGELHGD